MGEDICLFEEESGSELSQTDADVGRIDHEVTHNGDLLVEKTFEVEEDEDGGSVEGHGKGGVKATNINVSNDEDSDEHGRWSEEVRSPDRTVALSTPTGVFQEDLEVIGQLSRPWRSNLKLVLQAGFLMRKTGHVQGAGHGVRVLRRVPRQRTVVAGQGRGAGNGCGIITMRRQE
ncbi:hypothetical protein P8452_75883 [Trifolium repens]|nr:hypothetical protein P8452_75883 [Trifolium repens]